ncbi:MAG: hypothetical protein A2Y93_04765 [Chloroflexi bacterium RBG_13_68_17]|nr:MAG: hypothetical protein A2Y93_04765 [Chloroflexi bacterium RBG_13_68_17]
MDAFPAGLSAYLVGGGTADLIGASGIRLTIPPLPGSYADAQIDDTQRLPRARFRWQPPMRMRLEARASIAAPLGTLGFGFWNDPFTLSLGQGGAARRVPAAPQALWFFYGSPPNDLAFSADAPGHGWKAVSLRPPSVPGLLLAPAAAGALMLSRLPGLARPIVGLARRVVYASEAALPVPLDSWHAYSLSWHRCEAIFAVDDSVVLVAGHPPGGRLGFVAWIDNQYAALSPRTGLRFGLVPTAAAQALEIRNLVLESL